MISEDQSVITAIRVIKYDQQTLLFVCVGKQLIIFEINRDGSVGSKQQTIHLEGDGNVRALDLQIDNQDILHVLVVDSANMLHVRNYSDKSTKQMEEISHA